MVAGRPSRSVGPPNMPGGMLVNMTSREFWLGSQMTVALSLRNRGSTAKSQPPARRGGRWVARGSLGRLVRPFAEVGVIVRVPPQELERDLLGRQVVAVFVVGVIAPIGRNRHGLPSLRVPAQKAAKTPT